MEISIFQAILLGLLYYLTNNGTPWVTGLGSVSIRQPIVCGTITGLILGDPIQGCIIGATINTLYLGFVNAGGTLPADAGIGGIVGTALAISSGSTAEAAVAIAVPLGVIGTMVWTLRQTVNVYFVHQMDKAALEGDTKKMGFWQCWPAQIFACLVTAVPVAALIYLGAPAVQGVIDMLSGTPLHILNTIGGLLPAIGIAMLLRMLNTRSGILLFFVLGFFLESYSGLSMLIVAIFAGVFAYVYSELKFKEEPELEA